MQKQHWHGWNAKDNIEYWEKLFKEHEMMVRGIRFGKDPKYAMVNMLTSEGVFEQCLERVSNIEGRSNGQWLPPYALCNDCIIIFVMIKNLNLSFAMKL